MGVLENLTGVGEKLEVIGCDVVGSLDGMIKVTEIEGAGFKTASGTNFSKRCKIERFNVLGTCNWEDDNEL